MKTSLVFNFHSPLVLNPFSFFDIGKGRKYISTEATEKTFEANMDFAFKEILEWIFSKNAGSGLKCSLWFSGVFLELLVKKHPALAEKIQALVQKEELEIVGGTFHHSIASLFSENLFELELSKYKKLVKQTFSTPVVTFCNAENIYFNSLTGVLRKKGYKQVITEAVAWYFINRSSSQVFNSFDQKLKLILNRQETSDPMDGVGVFQIDPLIEEKKDWAIYLDYVYNSTNPQFLCKDLVKDNPATEKYSVPNPIGRNHGRWHFSYFTENAMQREIISKILSVEKKLLVLKKKDALLELSAFTAVEFFLKMNYKNLSSLSGQPYDFYISFMNILTDFELKWT